MEFKISKEQIDELARTGNADTERYLRCVFPEAFKKELEVGRWYKHNSTEALICYQGNEKSYGISNWGHWSNGYYAANALLWREATKEEIEAVLIDEARKKGYKKGVKCNNSNVHNCEFEDNILSTDQFYYDATTNELRVTAEPEVWYSIFKAGQWAEILPTEKTTEWTPAPTEKTVITLKKALKILAKKLKVSPENIEIE